MLKYHGAESADEQRRNVKVTNVQALPHHLTHITLNDWSSTVS
jgi:hypothetical protein